VCKNPPQPAHSLTAAGQSLHGGREGRPLENSVLLVGSGANG
jgi:hypothetical protein